LSTHSCFVYLPLQRLCKSSKDPGPESSGGTTSIDGSSVVGEGAAGGGVNPEDLPVSKVLAGPPREGDKLEVPAGGWDDDAAPIFRPYKI